MKWTYLLLAAPLFQITAARSQTPSAPVSQAQVHLEAKDGNTHFLLGDPIQLELVFSDPAFPDRPASAPPGRANVRLPGQRTVNVTDYGDLADDVIITPATGWFQWRGRSGHDYAALSPLTVTPVRVPLLLNLGFVFRTPGHYQIRVSTHRLSDSNLKPVETDALAIDIAPRPAPDEAALVRSLETQIRSQSPDDCDCSSGSSPEDLRCSAAQQLAFLEGDDAVRAKIRWLTGDDRDIASEITNGLASSKNLDLQLRLLEAAWRDPTRPPNGLVLRAIQQTRQLQRGQAQPGWSMIGRAVPLDDDARRQAAEHLADIQQIIDSLPQRTGTNRRDTAYFLIENAGADPAQLAAVKPLAIEEFPRMEPMAQSTLIENGWRLIRDPALVPALRAMLDDPQQGTDTATALQRLLELQPDGARPDLVRAICNPRAVLLLNKLNAVPADRIPEVDSCLAADLRVPPPRPNDFQWEQKATLAARFASPAMLHAMIAFKPEPWQLPFVFAILLRNDPAAAIRLLNRQAHPDWIFFMPANQVYLSLGANFPPQLLTWLRDHASSDPSRSSVFAGELAQFSRPADHPAAP